LLFNLIIILALASGLLLQPLTASAAPAIRYQINVNTTTDEYDITGTGTGCSLREAIKTANDGVNFGGCFRFFLTIGFGVDTIFVPSGTYTLTLAGTGEDLDATGDLDIRNSMVIGASGATPPVVTGEVGWTDRIFHILIGTAAINGFIISQGVIVGAGGGAVRIETGATLIMNNGQVDASFALGSFANGGGIYNNSTLTLNNEMISSNTADVGGAIYNLGMSTLNNVTISGNSANGAAGGIFNAAGIGVVVMNNGSISGNFGSDIGGAIYVTHGTLTLNNVNISGNGATAGTDQSGGGIYLDSSGATLTNVTIDGNHAGYYGGGIFTTESVVTMTNVILSNNIAGYGGGVYIGLNSTAFTGGSLTLEGGGITGNQAAIGGGIYQNKATVGLSFTTLSKNSSTSNGGGIYLENGTLSVSNSTLSNNSTSYQGGGIYSTTGSPALTNSTFSGNSAPLGGGGIFVNSGTPVLINVTLSGNSSSAGLGGGISGRPSLLNTIVANSPSGGNCLGLTSPGDSNLSDDATCGFGAGRDSINMALLPLGHYGGPTQTIMLLPVSQAIDFADDTACPTTDQRGLPRPVGPHCDVGAVERQLIDYPLIFLPLIRN